MKTDDIMKMLIPTTEKAEDVMVSLNVGCTMDIPTGEFVESTIKDSNGTYVTACNGGLFLTTGILGDANLGKTGFMTSIALQAAARLKHVVPVAMHTHDTELTLQQKRLKTLAKAAGFETDLIDDGNWLITSAKNTPGNIYFKDFQNMANMKMKNAKSLQVPTVFKDNNGKAITMMIPSISILDSTSEFKVDAVMKMLDLELGDGKQNKLSMDLGKIKNIMVGQLGELTLSSQTYLLTTGHIGGFIDMAGGPPGVKKSARQLSSMRMDETVKGLPKKFFYLLGNVWQIYRSTEFRNGSNKDVVQFPYDEREKTSPIIDLMQMTVKLLRSKSGYDNILFTFVASKKKGLLPTMTEFNLCKINKFGFLGNDRTYQSIFRPEINLTRMNVRSLLEKDPKLARAIQITADLIQVEMFHGDRFQSIIVPPEELYENMIKLGYDWEKILETRNWVVPNNDKAPGFYLNIVNLLRANKGEYLFKELMADKKK